MKKRAFPLIVSLLLLLGGLTGARAVIREPYATEPTAPVWSSYDPSLHYYYQQLTDAEKRVFSARYDCVALGRPALWDEPGLDAAGRMRVDYALLTDCPELMYMPIETGLGGVLLKPEEDWCAGHPGDIERLMADCRTALEAIRQRPEWGESDFEKQLAVDRHIVSACRYDLEEEYSTYASFTPDPMLRTAHAALAGGRAVCAGYAQGLQLALRCLDIPCLIAYGYVYDGAGRANPHAWNMVRIDGEWYHHDVTWNDWDDETMLEDFFPYLNLDTLTIRQTHSDDPARSALGFSLPRCEAEGANYYAMKGRLLGDDWRDTLPALLWAAREDGQTALGVRFRDAACFEEALASYEAGDGTLFGPKADVPRVNVWEDVNFLYFRW